MISLLVAYFNGHWKLPISIRAINVDPYLVFKQILEYPNLTCHQCVCFFCLLVVFLLLLFFLWFHRSHFIIQQLWNSQASSTVSGFRTSVILSLTNISPLVFYLRYQVLIRWDLLKYTRDGLLPFLMIQSVAMAVRHQPGQDHRITEYPKLEGTQKDYQAARGISKNFPVRGISKIHSQRKKARLQALPHLRVWEYP